MTERPSRLRRFASRVKEAFTTAIRRIGVRLGLIKVPAPPPPPPPPVVVPPPKPPVLTKEVEYRVFLKLYKFYTTYTERKTMPIEEKPESFYSEVKSRARDWFWELPDMWATPAREESLKVEIGYEEV